MNETLKELIRRRRNCLGMMLERGTSFQLDHRNIPIKLTNTEYHRIEGQMSALNDVWKHLNGQCHHSSTCSLCNKEKV
jgi:hypothetical protein